MQNFDCIVIGGGMIGLAAAKALSDLNLSIAIIEPNKPPLRWNKDSHALRVSAINKDSQTLLEQLGAWDTIQKHAAAYAHMQVWDENSIGEIAFGCTDANLPELGHIIENRVVTRALWQILEKTVTLFCPEKLTELKRADDTWSVTLESGKTLSTKCIIGADGARSMVRSIAGIQTEPTLYNQNGLVATIRTEQPHQKTAWQRFLTTGPLAFLPLQNDNLCSIVWTLTPDQAKALCECDETEFNTKLTEAFEHKLGPCAVVSKRASFPLAHHHANKYCIDGLILVGDAAHSIHPLAGLGANLGFHDVICLQKQVKLCQDKKRPFYTEHSLKKVEQQARFKNELTRQVMSGLNALFSNKNPLLKHLRGLGLQVINKQSILKTFFVRMAGD